MPPPPYMEVIDLDPWEPEDAPGTATYASRLQDTVIVLDSDEEEEVELVEMTRNNPAQQPISTAPEATHHVSWGPVTSISPTPSAGAPVLASNIPQNPVTEPVLRNIDMRDEARDSLDSVEIVQIVARNGAPQEARRQRVPYDYHANTPARTVSDLTFETSTVPSSNGHRRTNTVSVAEAELQRQRALFLPDERDVREYMRETGLPGPLLAARRSRPLFAARRSVDDGIMDTRAMRRASRVGNGSTATDALPPRRRSSARNRPLPSPPRSESVVIQDNEGEDFYTRAYSGGQRSSTTNVAGSSGRGRFATQGESHHDSGQGSHTGGTYPGYSILEEITFFQQPSTAATDSTDPPAPLEMPGRSAAEDVRIVGERMVSGHSNHVQSDFQVSGEDTGMAMPDWRPLDPPAITGSRHVNGHRHISPTQRTDLMRALDRARQQNREVRNARHPQHEELSTTAITRLRLRMNARRESLAMQSSIRRASLTRRLTASRNRTMSNLTLNDLVHFGDADLSYEQMAGLDGNNRYGVGGATSGQIARFPIVKATAQHATDRCAICLSDIEVGESLRQLPCTHVYHPGCIDSWLARSSCCPVDKLRV